MRGNLVLGMVRGGGEARNGGDVIRRCGTVELPVSWEGKGIEGESRFTHAFPVGTRQFQSLSDALGFADSWFLCCCGGADGPGRGGCQLLRLFRPYGGVVGDQRPPALLRGGRHHGDADDGAFFLFEHFPSASRRDSYHYDMR